MPHFGPALFESEENDPYSNPYWSRVPTGPGTHHPAFGMPLNFLGTMPEPEQRRDFMQLSYLAPLLNVMSGSGPSDASMASVGFGPTFGSMYPQSQPNIPMPSLLSLLRLGPMPSQNSMQIAHAADQLDSLKRAIVEPTTVPSTQVTSTPSDLSVDVLAANSAKEQCIAQCTELVLMRPPALRPGTWDQCMAHCEGKGFWPNFHRLIPFPG
jgi:hypothetical protein